jgi:hypothetical protein
MKSILVAADIEFQGLCRSRHRTKYKKLYKRLKQCSTAGGVATILVKTTYEFIKDVAAEKVISQGYPYLIVLVPDGCLIGTGALLYSCFNKFKKIKGLGVVLYNSGMVIFQFKNKCANLGWIPLDITLFGEIVPIIDDTPNLFIRNETVIATEAKIAFINKVNQAVALYDEVVDE